MKNIEQFVFYTFLVLIVWLPIPLGSNRDWAWAVAELWIATQSILLLVAYKGVLPFQLLRPYKVLLFGLLIFQGWVLVQTIPLPLQWLALVSTQAADIYRIVVADFGYISLDSRTTQLSFFKGLSYLLFLINAIFLVNSSQRIRLIAIALVISGTLQAFYAAISVLLNTTESWFFGFPEKDIATGSFVYKNHLANYLMVTLCIGVGLIITQLHVSQSISWRMHAVRLLEGMLSPKMLIRMCLIIMVIALVMTRSRMGNTAFFAATTLCGFIALLFYKNKPRALTALVTSVIAIDTIVIGALFGLNKVKQRLAETSLGEESRDQVVIWSMDIIRDFPIVGTGMGSFYSVFPIYSKSDIGFYDHAHNDYIQFMVEAGVPATVLLGCVVLYSLFRSFKTIRVRNSKTMKGLALGTMMATVGMLIHISVDFNLQPMANALTFILVLFMANATAVLPAVGSVLTTTKAPEAQREIVHG
ncbi:O-antigen ligase family protein [Vibrio europaeus]|uniref:O-antigen ligase family protein n=1 Tax=Vibrio europaeus TaxID=300876 RepID=A0A178J8G5_9VIBR|nr:O-antigen ligase family protein [Vibrio europaeus]MDC5705008.1 O-antigen ligase family protein [Vibrio europaeus]MDC5710287.1 O-antigen ligase family protein [Vibrio europaeus]MDC5715377.1 O-antigen ligase family protein [Vibrio europaeus]MDC5719538.1 O-antigen ligase family protein [Vibrio europaeus]MDC5724574.1 O-antigen ligase family protein [Vibrio europaeus]